MNYKLIKYFLLIIGLQYLLAAGLGVIGLKIPAALISMMILIGYGLGKKEFGRASTYNNKSFITVNFIVLILCISWLWSPSMINKYDKFYLMLYTIIAPLFLINFFSGKDWRYERHSITKITRWLILIFCGIYIAFSNKEFGGSRYILSGIDNPIAISRMATFLLLVFLIFLKNNKLSFVDYSAFVVAIISVAMSGSKAPVLALIICLIYWYWEILNFKKLVLIVLGLIGTYQTLSVIMPNSYLFDNDFHSVFYRIEALEFILSAPITMTGHGFGSYDLIFYGVDGPGYPHNIFAEIYFESGLIIMMLMAIFVILIVFKKKSNKLYHVFFLFWIINSQFSGDLPGNSVVFLSAYLVISDLYKKIKYDENKIKISEIPL